MRKRSTMIGALLAALGCSEGTAPIPSPDARMQVAVAAGDAQLGDAGAGLPLLLSVKALDADGAPLPGVHVRWGTPTGGGSVVGDTVTGPTGLATAQWTLGPIADTALSVHAEVAGRVDLAYGATTRTPSTAVITARPRVSTVRSVVGQVVADTLSALVTLADGRPLEHALVTWQALDGGQVASVSARTDALGIARARWTLGSVVKTQTLKAMLDATRVATFAITPAAGPVTAVSLLGPASVVVGTTGAFAAQPVDAYGNAVTDPATWSSSTPSVATVDQQGNVRGIATGSATITATVQGVSATRAVTIAPNGGLAGVVALRSGLWSYSQGTDTWFEGLLTRRGTDVNVSFEYGLKPDLSDKKVLGPVLYSSTAAEQVLVFMRAYLWHAPYDGTVWYFRMVAENSFGRAVSAIVQWPRPETTPPPTPSILLSGVPDMARVTSVGLNFVADPEGSPTTYFALKRSLDGQPFEYYRTSPFGDTDVEWPLTSPRTVQYTLRACNAAGCSNESAPTPVLTTAPLPVATNVTATATGSWNVRVDFTRDDSTYPAPVGPTRIQVRRVSDQTGFDVTLTNTSLRQTTIAMPQVAGVAYTFTVFTSSATGSWRLSAASNSATATPVP